MRNPETGNGFERYYNILGVHISLSTHSRRILDQASIFLDSYRIKNPKLSCHEIILQECNDDISCKDVHDMINNRDLNQYKYKLCEDKLCIITKQGIALLYMDKPIVYGFVRINESFEKKEVASVSLINMIVLRIMIEKSFIPLHAAAVEKGSKLFLFGGPSKSGKSSLSLSLHQHGMPIIADDIVLIKKQNGKLYAGGYCKMIKLHSSDMDAHYWNWLAKTDKIKIKDKNLLDISAINPKCFEKMYPIEMIFFLENTNTDHLLVQPLSEHEALFKLIELSVMSDNEAIREKSFNLWSSLKGISLFSVKRGMNQKALSSEIFMIIKSKIK